MEYKSVLSKRDFVPRYAAGEFGNASPTWMDLFKFIEEADPRELYHLRNGAVAGGMTYYKQTYLQAIKRWREAENRGDWYCSMQVPSRVEQSLLLQGEVILTPWSGINLLYSRVKEPMRTALATHSESSQGIIAVSLLRWALCPNSYEWLQELLDRYPEHAVEFSAYERRWGTLPNFNTLFWEVRYY